ncbi:MAG TPA: hypothetical protein VFG29_09750 [Syntrophales bacterium]|nr:hypothetical protein [Syntrophales bacterium]
MYKKIAKSNNVEDLKNSLQEAEIIRSCTRIALKNPSLDPESRGEYEIACMRLNAQIRELKMRMDNIQRKTHSPRAL